MGLAAPLLLLLLFLGSTAAARTQARVTDRKRVTANFDYNEIDYVFPETIEHERLPPGLHPSPPTLSLTTVQLCESSEECLPCIRAHISMDTTGYLDLRGFEIHFLERSSNQHKTVRITKLRNSTIPELVEIQYDCFKAKVGYAVVVSLVTIPNYGFKVNQTYSAEGEDPVPAFTYVLVPEERAIHVSVPVGPDVKARLCYQQARVCEEPKGHSFQLIRASRSKNFTLHYGYLVPCLCIEMCYLPADSKRLKICPFQESPEAYGSDFWRSGRFHDLSPAHKDQMAMKYKSLCPVKPVASLCQKHDDMARSLCEDIPNSTTMESNSVYRIDKVDNNPYICFKFSCGNSSHVECPHTRDTAWSVTAELRALQLFLHFNSRIPASFSAAACTPKAHHCDSSSPVYTVRRKDVSSPEEFHLIVPFRAIGSCVQVWRSDVLYATKHLICPDFSNRRLGLMVLCFLLGILVVLFFLLLNYRCVQKMFRAPLWRRTVLLIYSLDSEEYKFLICAFADFLHSVLGCEVILDLWDVGKVAQIGIVPWIYSKRELVKTEKGKVIIVWTKGSRRMYDLWERRDVRGNLWRDSHDLFSAAMACLHSDLKEEAQKERLGDYTLVYFEGLCEKQDIPGPLRAVRKYRLFEDLHGLVNELRRASRPLPCWIRAGAKFLGLLCTLDETEVLCMPDSLRSTQGPVLEPAKMRTKTVLHCREGENCSPCVRVELDMNVIGNLQGSGSEDGESQIAEEEETDEEGSSSEGSISYCSNGTFIKTLLIFSQTHPSQICIAAEVCVPLIFLQENLYKENVGTVVFDCFETVPSAEVHLQSYTSPRFTEKLTSTHGIPNCKQLRQMGDVKTCQVPRLQVSIQKDVVIGVRKVSRVREYLLRLYYNQSHKEQDPLKVTTLNTENSYSIPHSDIVPCLCIEAWWKDIEDAPRQATCPFWNYSEYEENVWRKTNLILKVPGKIMVWQLQALCSVVGEIVLCWNSSLDSHCQEIPHSRQKILVNVVQEFKPVIRHPALCVQVWREGKVWRTQCPQEKANETTREGPRDSWGRNHVLIMVNENSVSNVSICILEGGSCISLRNSTMSLHKAAFLERQLLQDSLSDKCEMVWSPHGNLSGAVLLCPLDKYIRLRSTLAWPICILIAFCALVLSMLQKERLKEWLKSLKEDYNSPGFVSSRRVLILYSPDHAAFERLVGIFASALQDLQFKVTVDLWCRSKISAIGTMAWFHSQQREVLEQNGAIILLFSKGALDKCTEWLHLRQEMQPLLPEKPHTTFAASLNCVIPAILKQKALGHYVIACFEDLFCEKDIPFIFRSVPVFLLPSQLPKFLVAVAGGHKMVMSKDLIKNYSKRINHTLTEAIRKCKRSQALESQQNGCCSEPFIGEQE
uniref:Interleukin-17 receptor C n=1 Tax=Geotrypetes seraphini TaxID=260995 RepID=A0A6P8PDF1_GEOSA|nr:interleukin-17 receptor C [Geotrypetes seraphini]